MSRFDWLLAPWRAGRQIPKPVLLAGVALSAALGSAFGIALAVVEWRDEDVDLRPIDQRLAELETASSPTDGRLKLLEARLVALSDDLEEVRSDVQALSPTVSPLEPTLTPVPIPTTRLTVNWVQRAVEFSGFGSNKPWVVVNVTIENTSADEVDVFYSGFQFTARDDQEFVYPAVFPTGPFSCGPISEGREKILEPPLSGGSLAPGEKARGDLAFDIPEGTVLTQLAWNAGLPETPAVVVDLPPPQTQNAC